MDHAPNTARMHPSRLGAALAAFAVVLAGMGVVAPAKARAASAETLETITALAIFGAATIVAFVVIDEQDDDAGPVSP